MSYSIAPPGMTTLPGTFRGVACSTNPNSVGQPDGGFFIDQYYSGWGNIVSNPNYGFPSSGSFLVVGCGMVHVNVYGAPSVVMVDIN